MLERKTNNRIATTIALAALAVIMLGIIGSLDAATGTAPGQAAQTAPAKMIIPDVVAQVNGQPITRAQLAAECLKHHGPEILERLINKHLIQQECVRRRIEVTNQEVADEVARMAKVAQLPVDKHLELLRKERGIDPDQYSNEIIWPTLAIRKLAKDQVVVTDEDIQKEFQKEYGPKVQVRMIVCRDKAHADDVRARLNANPADFERIAKNESTDVNSAAAGGLIYPIRYHTGPVEIEKTVFALAKGQISDIIFVLGDYMIFRCEQHFAVNNVIMTPEIRSRLEFVLQESKLRPVAGQMFQTLQKNAQVENIIDNPVRSQQLPGVAALINGREIRTAELAEVCLTRHSTSVLEILIARTVQQQACMANKIIVTQQEVDAEIRRQAMVKLPLTPQGQPNIRGWLDIVKEQTGMTPRIYAEMIVRPGLELNRLAGKDVRVTEEDIQKGYEANFGPKVHCLAIVLDNARRAQEVFGKARQNLTKEYFGQLAGEYSVEGGGRALQGEVPPIQMHGGQPILEREAFKLRPGEISGIISIGYDRYAILYCVEQMAAPDIDMVDVRDSIIEDLLDKKKQIASANYFENLYSKATIYNHLTGKNQIPQLTIELDDQLGNSPAAPSLR